MQQPIHCRFLRSVPGAERAGKRKMEWNAAEMAHTYTCIAIWFLWLGTNLINESKQLMIKLLIFTNSACA